MGEVVKGQNRDGGGLLRLFSALVALYWLCLQIAEIEQDESSKLIACLLALSCVHRIY